MPRESIALSGGELRAFLEKQTWLLLVTLDATGAPFGALVRSALDGDRLLFELAEDDEAASHIARDPRVCVANDEYPDYYQIRGATLHGRAQLVGDPAAPERTGLGGKGRHLYALALDDVVSFDFSKIQRKI